MTVEPTVLLCLPFAGGGASFFRSWAEFAPPALRVLPVQLPGHEKRFAEEPHTDVHAVADLLAAETAAELTGSAGARAVALFGHSLGAVLAYELARRLSDRAGVDVTHLFVSGSPGPWTPRTRHATGLADEEFVARVREFAGYEHEALDHPGMRELLLPVLRADVAMHEGYRPRSTTPLPVPVTALRGTDDLLVTDEDTGQWLAATGAAFDLVRVPGGHMYLTASAPAVLRIIEQALSGLPADR